MTTAQGPFTVIPQLGVVLRLSPLPPLSCPPPSHYDRNRVQKNAASRCQKSSKNWAQASTSFKLNGCEGQIGMGTGLSVGGVLEHMLRAHCTSVFDYLHKKKRKKKTQTHLTARFRFSFPFRDSIRFELFIRTRKAVQKAEIKNVNSSVTSHASSQAGVVLLFFYVQPNQSQSNNICVYENKQLRELTLIK